VELRGLTEVERLVRRLTYLIAAASMAAAIAFVIALVLWATG
jgi:hypothetical protein